MPKTQILSLPAMKAAAEDSPVSLPPGHRRRDPKPSTSTHTISVEVMVEWKPSGRHIIHSELGRGMYRTAAELSEIGIVMKPVNLAS